MRFASALSLLVSITLFAVAPGCGDDDDDDKGTPATAGDGGSTTPVNPEAPGVTAKDCPSAPANINLVKVAPVWSGLIVVEATVDTGAPPTTFDTQMFDPALGEWRTVYAGGLVQRPDGKYVFSFSPDVRESTKAAEHKMRLRSRLDGCPPSAWTETPGFTLGDPITGTTWKLDIPVGLASANVYVSHTGPGSVTTNGPYDVSQEPMSHTITFNADGSLSETYALKITSKTNGDLYKDCSFQVSFAGKWQLRFVNDNMSVLIYDRKPKADALAGSTCAAPPLAELAGNQADNTITVQTQSSSLNIDFSPLRLNPPGKPTWSTNLYNGFNNGVFEALSDSEGADTANVSGNAYPQYAYYERQ